MTTTATTDTTDTADTAPGAPPPAHPSETVRDLPLSALTLSERNVRTVDDTPEESASLKASILAHGLIENLAVRPVDELYEVIAGKRRFRAMRELVDEGEIHPGMMVACRILDESANDTEISLAENEARVVMHPVDQVTAFRRLTEEGIDREKIAERFGVSTRTVDQRLRLAGLPAGILDAARDGELNLEHLHAFAATADQSRQLEVWNRIKDQDYQPGTHWIRAELTRQSVRADHSRARFVGVEAYTAAGGRVEVDLFSDGEDDRAMLIDPQVLDKLATDRLQQVADGLKAQGWKWAEPRLELEWDATHDYGRLRGTPAEATGEQAAELERIGKRVAEIDARLDAMSAEVQEEHDGEPPGDHPYWALIDEREQLEEEENRVRIGIEQNVTYSPEQMACAGCLVTIEQFTGLVVQAGLVRPADAGDVPQPPGPAEDGAGQAGGAGQDGGGPGGAPAPDGYTPPTKRRTAKNPETEAVKSAGLSNTLAEDLRLVRTAMVKAHLANDFEAAFDLAAYEMSLSAFGSHIYGARPLAMTLNSTADRPLGSPQERAAFEAASPGIELFERDRAELPLDWLNEQDPGRRFLAFTDLSLTERQGLFAAATARALNKQLSFDHNAHPETEATVARLDIPFEALWRPGLDRFWSQMRKGEMLAVARRTLGPEWAAAHAKDKKNELAEAMAAAFGRDGEAGSLGLTPAARAAALGWTPAGFRAFDPARPPAEDASGGAEPAAPAGTKTETVNAGPAAGTTADATGTAEADQENDANGSDAAGAGTTTGAGATTGDTLNGKLLKHPTALAENGNGAPLDDGAGEDGEASDTNATEPFDHGQVDELPPFLQK